MYARLVRFRYGPGGEAKVRELADDLVPAIEKLPGARAPSASVTPPTASTDCSCSGTTRRAPMTRGL